jgi:hypothetical protein
MKERNNLSKIIAILAAFAMFICTGCAEKKEEYANENNNLERNAVNMVYVATKIEIPTDAPYIESLSSMSDGTIRITVFDGNAESRQVWDSKDSGKTWEENSMGKEILLSLPENEGYKFSVEGELYFWNYENGIVDVSGKSIPVYEDEGDLYVDSAFAGGILTVLIQNPTGNKIRQYQVDTGEEIDNDDLRSMNTDAHQLATDETGNVIYLESSKIIRFDTESNFEETLIDSKEMINIVPFEMGDFFGISVGMGDELYLRVISRDGLSDSLYKVSKGAVPTISMADLKVYTLKEHPPLRQMIAFYEAEHPDVKVELQVGYTDEDGTNISDAVRSLNTEILAGDGPDVIVLDGLPVKQYTEKGFLENVLDVVKPERDVLFENIISACNSGSEIYVVPTSFTIPIIVGDQKVVQSKNIVDLVTELKTQNGNGIPALAVGAFPVTVVNLFVTSDLLEEQIDRMELRKFYENVKDLFDLTMSEVSYEKLVEDYSLLDELQRYPSLPGSDVPLDIYAEEARAGTVMLENSDEFAKIASLCKERGLSYANLNRGSGNTFSPSLLLGISATGKHKDEAKEFLRNYLTKLPDNALGIGFSVNKVAFRNSMPVSDAGEAYTKSSKKNQDLSSGLTVYKFTKEEFSQVEAFIGRLDTASQDNQIIMECVMEQAQKYLYDGIDLDSAVNAAFEKINLYMKE